MTRFFRWFGLPGSLVLTLLLDVTALTLACIYRTPTRALCVFAMLLSTVGDLILMEYPPIRKYLKLRGLLAGGSFFVLSHLVYAEAFLFLAVSSGLKSANVGTLAGIGLFLLTVAVLIVSACVVRGAKKGALLMWIPYLLFIMLNVTAVFTATATVGGATFLSAVGAFSFLVSDLFIAFPDVLRKRLKHQRTLIWTFYPIGQFLLLLGAGATLLPL